MLQPHLYIELGQAQTKTWWLSEGGGWAGCSWLRASAEPRWRSRELPAACWEESHGAKEKSLYQVPLQCKIDLGVYKTGIRKQPVLSCQAMHSVKFLATKENALKNQDSKPATFSGLHFWSIPSVFSDLLLKSSTPLSSFTFSSFACLVIIRDVSTFVKINVSLY